MMKPVGGPPKLAHTAPPVSGARKAAQEFESVFIRQLLSTAKVAGSKTQSTYGGMAVDALASGLSDSGGLGLADLIARSLDPAGANGSDIQQAHPRGSVATDKKAGSP